MTKPNKSGKRPWQKVAPEEWDEEDLDKFIEHLMRPVIHVVMHRVKQILLAAGGQDQFIKPRRLK